MKSAIEARLEVDPSGEIMELKAGGCPWKEHLYDLEAELKLQTPIKFCIYEVRRGRVPEEVTTTASYPDHHIIRVARTSCPL